MASGLLAYAVFFLTLAGIFAVLTLGLNLQWGLTGMFNIGVAGFFAVGAYSAAILTSPESASRVGGFEMPFVVGAVVAMLLSGLLALLIGVVTLRLRTDYLAIATIGIAEIVRLTLKNESWLTNGVRGIPGVPRPISDEPLVYLGVVAVTLAVVYLALERAQHSPWGRVLRAIRENEPGVQAAGKNVFRFRLEAFVVGSMIMGLGGALYAHFFGFVSPEAFAPLYGTFIIWVMLIAGGSGNNRGALLGAFGIWLVWSATEMLTGRLPAEWVTQAGAIRVLLIGLLLQVILLSRPQGMLPESRPKPRKKKPLADG